MVQTRATTKRIDSGQRPPQDAADAPSRTKKRRVDGPESSKKQRRGKPGELCQLNLDVLFLLAAYVHPLDLLNLARTCKSLRELLMDKASAFVWKTARRKIRGLPDCPADMTEPEYANLLFYSRCHVRTESSTRLDFSEVMNRAVGNMRKRFCGNCVVGIVQTAETHGRFNTCFSLSIEFTSATRLRSLSSCPDIIRQNLVLPMEKLTIDGGMCYLCSSCHIAGHASQCRYWQVGIAVDHRIELELRRQERDQCIFQRLEQHGYGPEIAYFGHYEIQQSHSSFFKISKPLTDKEWARMWPDWLETMNDFRSQRIHRAVYQPRRNLLVTEYDTYVTSPSPNMPSLDLLPHVIELCSFPPFRDIIKAPEGTEMGEKPFESAFTQLPVLVDEWRKQLDAELAELVEIPSQLSPTEASSGRAVSSSSEMPMDSFQSPSDKLRLACAVFNVRHTVTWYPDVFFSTPRHTFRTCDGEWDREMPIQDRLGVKYLKDAPYVVHACGLDPNVATVEDMDRRNARLRCLYCNNLYIRSWKGALRHLIHCPTGQASCSDSSRWQLVGNEYMDAIQAAELSAKKELPLSSTRCLLCRPCIGDAKSQDFIMLHLVDW
ncbi:hypothetical protein HD554DRAFT_2244476 [Boletus coccyginus]|nr:hypothetical protein HD554DRAFT_2244476 [Boletus coccyginus]